MAHSTFGEDRKRLIGPAPPGLLANGPANNVGSTGRDGHGARGLARRQ